MTWTVEVLHYATGEVPEAQVRFQAGFDEWATFHFHVFLLRDGEQNVLIDCGIDNLGPFNAMLRAGLGDRGLLRPAGAGTTVWSLLADRGLSPEDIDVVALTHLHIDHVANAPMFPRARFLMSAEGHRRHRALAERLPEMVPDPTFPAEAIAFLGEPGAGRLELVEDGPTALPGLSIRYVGGHTADCAAYVADTPAGPVVFPSDTVWTYRNLEQRHPPGSVVDVAQAYATLRWVAGLEAVVLPPHEPELAAAFTAASSHAIAGEAT